MAIETKYICDRCKKEQAVSDQMWSISVAYSPYGTNAYQSSGQYEQHKQMWCRDCMEANGFFAYPPKEPTADPPPPGLEDLIRELVRSELEFNSRS